jgi:hypothetical protein
MTLPPVSAAQPQKHVTFAEPLVRVIFEYPQPTEHTEVAPSAAAQRLERAVKAQPNVAVIQHQRTAQQQETAPLPPLHKRLFYKAACVCGAFIIPSFCFLILGPIGLVAPAALAVASASLFLLAGKTSKEMQQAIANDQQALRARDFC